MAEKLERELAWDDTIDANADEFPLLEPGEYEFTVLGFERARFPGSAKLPPCPQAKVNLLVNGVKMVHNLYLHSKCEGLICAFFKAIGARKSGERLQMDWGKITGATGRCQVGIRKWKDRYGTERESNDISKFLPAEEVSTAQAPVHNTAPVPAPVATATEEVDDLPF